MGLEGVVLKRFEMVAHGVGRTRCLECEGRPADYDLAHNLSGAAGRAALVRAVAARTTAPN